MSIIILPSQADQRKTFHALRVQPALRLGVVRGHIDPIFIAAICLPKLIEGNYDDIVIGLEGMIPRRYSVQSVKEEIHKNPRKFAGWIPRSPRTRAEQQRDAMLRRYMHGKPGAITLL